MLPALTGEWYWQLLQASGVGSA